MKERYNSYDYIGVIAPGTVVVFVLTVHYPALRTLLVNDGITVGGLGLFVLLAFITGHLLQAVGNIYEALLWKPFGGIPSNWIVSDKQSLVSKDQKEKIRSFLMNRYGDFDWQTVSSKDWYSISRELYKIIEAKGDIQRIEVFNRNYGLMRGVASAFAVASFLIAFILDSPVEYILYSVLGLALATARMYRFGVHYAREVYVSFLALNG